MPLYSNKTSKPTNPMERYFEKIENLDSASSEQSKT